MRAELPNSSTFLTLLQVSKIRVEEEKSFSKITCCTGDFIRTEIAQQTELGKQMQAYTSSGSLVPDAIVIELLTRNLKRTLMEHNAKGYLLDGFPRTVAQAQAFQQVEQPDLVVNLTQQEDIIITKITNRRVCNVCGANYNLAHIKQGSIDMPPMLPVKEGVCDSCGSQGSIAQREDDRLDVVTKRLAVYKKNTVPLIDFYAKLGVLKTFEVCGGATQLLPSFVQLLKE